MQEINVQVAVRVRPLLEREILNQDQKCVYVKPHTNEVVVGKDRSFVFDNVFDANIAQDEICKTCIESLVDGCFDGYNATILAYGQTGSGKTYTMGTKPLVDGSSEMLGVIPRAINKIFEVAQTLEDRLCVIRVSFIEVYKDELIDLLDMEAPKEISIREDPQGNTIVIGSLQVECFGSGDVMQKLWEGSLHRRTGTTQMNDQSSRSHTIFTIYIEQKHVSKKQNFEEFMPETEINYTCAKFHFVDLAGSERANRTGNIGERFKESIHINTGLLALGNVISALGEQKKKVHIPYRDSKITRLLKDSLGGNARTLMICCVSPSVSDYDETLNSLKYANRARKIKNKPIVNHDPFQLQVEELKTEIETLKDALQQEKSKNISNDKGTLFLQQELSSLKQDCLKYYEMAKEAFKHIKTLQEKALLSQSVDGHFKDWMEVMDDLKHWNEIQMQDTCFGDTIQKLQSELKKKENETVMKDGVISKQAMDLAKFEAHLMKLQEENRSLNQKPINLDDNLMDCHKKLENFSSEDNSDESKIILMRQRAKSVPSYGIGLRKIEGMIMERNIHTSPGNVTVEKIGSLLRQKTAFLTSELEDADVVSSYREMGGDIEREGIFQENIFTPKACMDLSTRETNKLEIWRENIKSEDQKLNLEKLKYEEMIKKIEEENAGLKLKLEQYEQENKVRYQDCICDQNKNCQQIDVYKCNSEDSNLQPHVSQQDKLIKAKLRTMTVQEMRSVVTSSNNWIDEQINVHIQEREVHESLKENIMARNKLLQEKMQLEKFRTEIQNKIKGSITSRKEMNKNTSYVGESNVSWMPAANSLDLQLLNECEETLDAIESTLEFRNDTITGKQEDLGKSRTRMKDDIFLYSKIKLFSQEEIIFLLLRFFRKLIDLKCDKRKMLLNCNHMKITIDEKNKVLRDLDIQLNGLKTEYEKKLTKTQNDLKEYKESFNHLEALHKQRISELSKEVLYYKTNFRELKRKLRQKSAGNRDQSKDVRSDISNDQSSLINPENQNNAKFQTPRSLTKSPTKLENIQCSINGSKEDIKDSLEE